MSKIDDATLKVKKLTEQKGFIYAFLMLVVRDCFYDRNHPEELEAREKLIVEELMFLLGLWLKKDSGWLDYPESLQQLCLMVENADEYMKELHMAFLERTATEVNLWHNQENRQPDFQLSEEAIADNIHEAIFYSGDYTYDIELCYFLEPKYRYDLDWPSRVLQGSDAGTAAYRVGDLHRRNALPAVRLTEEDAHLVLEEERPHQHPLRRQFLRLGHPLIRALEHEELVGRDLLEQFTHGQRLLCLSLRSESLPDSRSSSSFCRSTSERWPFLMTSISFLCTWS